MVVTKIKLTSTCCEISESNCATEPDLDGTLWSKVIQCLPDSLYSFYRNKIRQNCLFAIFSAGISSENKLARYLVEAQAT